MKLITQWIIVAFVTENTPYEFALSQYLLPSLDKLGLPFHIEVLENQHSWLKNVALKPSVILQAFEKYPTKDIISLDVDAEVLKYPDLFDNIPPEYDIACHYLDWDLWYGHKNGVKELLSGTLFLRNNERVKLLVSKWRNLAENSHTWEQKCLSEVLKGMPEIKVYPLPIEYIYIKTLPSGKEPPIQIDNPIIVHNQVSRQFKKQIR